MSLQEPVFNIIHNYRKQESDRPQRLPPVLI